MFIVWIGRGIKNVFHVGVKHGQKQNLISNPLLVMGTGGDSE